jgi:hypothetical protein
MSVGWPCWILQPSTYFIISCENVIFDLWHFDLCQPFSWTH